MTTEKDKATMTSNNNNPINDGGPAFPVSTRKEDADGGYGHQDGPSTYQFGGMTLRDYFAAKVMQSLSTGGFRVKTEQEVVDRALPEIARFSYLLADAMLRARSNYPDGGS